MNEERLVLAVIRKFLWKLIRPRKCTLLREKIGRCWWWFDMIPIIRDICYYRFRIYFGILKTWFPIEEKVHQSSLSSNIFYLSHQNPLNIIWLEKKSDKGGNLQGLSGTRFPPFLGKIRKQILHFLKKGPHLILVEHFIKILLKFGKY